MNGPVLVTGASGFVGGALLARLARQGVESVALARAQGGVPALAAGARTEVLALENLEAAALREALGGRRFAVVYHLASYGTAPGQGDAQAMTAGNATLVVDLLRALAQSPPPRFVFAGTWSAYAACAPPRRIDEAHPLDPRTPYAAAKVEAARAGRTVADELGVTFCELRLFHVYGPGEAGHRLVPHLVRALSDGASPPLTGGAQARDFVYVDDVADAFLAAGAAADLVPGAYNVCTGQAVEVREVVERVADLLGAPRQRLGLGALPYRAHEPMWAVGDPGKLARATGWRATVPLADGVARAVRHELERAA
jgi:nucleoside-diphosphate-sugar epimerase